MKIDDKDLIKVREILALLPGKPFINSDDGAFIENFLQKTEVSLKIALYL